MRTRPSFRHKDRGCPCPGHRRERHTLAFRRPPASCGPARMSAETLPWDYITFRAECACMTVERHFGKSKHSVSRAATKMRSDFRGQNTGTSSGDQGTMKYFTVSLLRLSNLFSTNGEHTHVSFPQPTPAETSRENKKATKTHFEEAVISRRLWPRSEYLCNVWIQRIVPHVCTSNSYLFPSLAPTLAPPRTAREGERKHNSTTARATRQLV